MIVSMELLKYKLDLVGVREVRWRAVAPNLQDNTQFSMQRRTNYNIQVEHEMGRARSTNGGEEERVQVIGRKAKWKKTARKTKT
jgi:hypothetical protein